MKKILICAFIIFGFVACKNVAGTSEGLQGILKNNLIHSVIKTTGNKNVDSLKVNNGAHFNFFLKDGFAKKFGL